MIQPYYQDELVTLYHGDCVSVMCEWLSGEASPDYGQIIVTSPPYNMGLVPGGNGRGMYRPGQSTKGGRFRDGYLDSHDDAMPQDEYDEWQRDCLRVMWDLIPDDGAIFWNHRQRIEHGLVRLPLGMDFPVPLRQILTWDRKTGIGPNLRHYCSVAEWVFLFAKPCFRLKDHSASGRGDIWRLGMAQKDYAHPAPFPVSLPLAAITTTDARCVLDPFAGSGTTLVAARLSGIPAFGIEKSEAYCETAARRLTELDLSWADVVPRILAPQERSRAQSNPDILSLLDQDGAV
jgi:site-specific DNA-methyltransferase (adenine-specific)